MRLVGAAVGLVLVLVGAGAVLVNAVNAVQATGLVGERGTFAVDYCLDGDGRAIHSDYTCRGTFTPRGGTEGFPSRGELDNAKDYGKGEQLDVTENLMGEGGVFRENGLGEVLLSALWLCFGLLALAMGYVVSRKWLRTFRSR